MQMCQVQPDEYYWLIVTDRKDQYFLYFPVKTFSFQNKMQKKLVGMTELIVNTLSACCRVASPLSRYLAVIRSQAVLVSSF